MEYQHYVLCFINNTHTLTYSLLLLLKKYERWNTNIMYYVLSTIHTHQHIHCFYLLKKYERWNTNINVLCFISNTHTSTYSLLLLLKKYGKVEYQHYVLCFINNTHTSTYSLLLLLKKYERWNTNIMYYVLSTIHTHQHIHCFYY